MVGSWRLAVVCWLLRVSGRFLVVSGRGSAVPVGSRYIGALDSSLISPVGRCWLVDVWCWIMEINFGKGVVKSYI